MKPAFEGRREDLRLITGKGKFTDDHHHENQSYAAFLRSPHAHAAIVSVATGVAKAAAGVLAVLTADDMVKAGYWRVKAVVPFRGRNGPLKSPALPPLAADRVRYVGEPVALVVALSMNAAQEAAQLIDIAYEPLAAVTDIGSALADAARLLYDDVPGNLCFDHDYGDATRTAEAFKDAACVARLTLESGRVVGNPLEPKAASALWQGDVLHLWCPSQGMTSLRDELAMATGLSAGNIRVHAKDVGGAFGVRGAIYPEYIALALAARQVGRPVKWLADRSETFVSDFHGRAIRMSGELALDRNGRFLAIRHDWLGDMGAWPSSYGPLTVLLNSSLMACGAYRIPAISGRTRLALTNMVPTSAYRGAGRPEMAYLVERLVDEAARLTGIDRIELRQRNMIPKQAFPYPIATAPFAAAYDSADFDMLLDAALETADWSGFAARQKLAADRGKLRGIGCALFIEPAGGVSPTDEAAITFQPDGSILVHVVAIASGQGHETLMPEIVGRVLEIPPHNISLRAGRQDGPVLKGAAAFGSRTAMSQGSVAAEAARLMLDKARLLAAEHLMVPVSQIGFAEGVFRTQGNRFIGLSDLAIGHPGQLDTIAELVAPRAFPSGAHVAEIEIDPETGAAEIIRYVSIDDCGTVLNHTLAEGQIIGGLVQGLGQVFGETCIFDAQGQMLSGSFMDYPMPRADLLPNVAIKTLEMRSPSNQLGAKGVGEAGTVGALPAAMNAVLDALSARGISHFDMPATPHRVWQSLRDAAREGKGAMPQERS